MTDKEPIDYQQLVKNALVEIRRLKAKITELEQPQQDIVIIGMACQFPAGAEGQHQDLDGFWHTLEHGVDAVIETPHQRFNPDQFSSTDPDEAGTIVSTQGGYLNDIDQFAADFFFISPREAQSMDPQQRMLLENHWRALEHAGIAPDSLMASQTGLFAGVCGNDYYHLLASRDYCDIDSYMASGTAHGTAVGRLAFYFGTQGPAIAVDTACSSSLVALHLACLSLRAGECELALASGVNALLSPEYSINFSSAGMLSPDGRCKTFDDSANGYVRGEGCGVVVLKTLEDASNNGDRVLAVIKGSATNQDGRSSGLTAPNGSAQREVLTEALQMAGVTPDQVSYVEAHGTGTSLGDPIEIEALQAVYGSQRNTPLNIGSVKSNIGHLEGAAGIAGVIKTVLMLQAGKIPGQLHFQQPNRHVDWEAMNLTVKRTVSEWTVEPDQQRMAGVSSFGFGGSNAHLIIAQAPESQQSFFTLKPNVELIALSAACEDELQHLASLYADYLNANPETELNDFSYNINARRQHFPLRSAFSCATLDQLLSSLQEIGSGNNIANPVNEDNRIAMLMSGQGGFNGVLNQLYDWLPVLNDELDYCEQAFQNQLNCSLKMLLCSDTGAARLQSTEYAQPALYCLQYVLGRVLINLGVEVECLIGHSVGEYAAACMAGVFSFEDGLMLVSQRGRLMQSLTEPGAMLAVFADAETVIQAIHSSVVQPSIAAFNADDNTVVSGTRNELETFKTHLDQHKYSYAELKVQRAFHSPLMTPMLDAFAEVVKQIEFRPPAINIISTKTGKSIAEQIATADYWLDQIVQPVQFKQAVAELRNMKINLALEIGPGNTLTNLVKRDSDNNFIHVMSVFRGLDCQSGLLNTLADLYQQGLSVNWEQYYQDRKQPLLSLPGYPFRRQRYWFKQSDRQHSSHQTRLHPLLHDKIELATEPGKQIFTAQLSVDDPACHQDHCYQGKILIPAAHYLEMTIAAVADVPCRIVDADYPEPLQLADNETRQLQLQLSATEDGYACVIHSRNSQADNTSSWHCHFKARVITEEMPCRSTPEQTESCQELPVEQFYQDMTERGIEFGPCYRLLEKLWVGESQAHATVIFSDAPAGYYLYPPILDACFQVSGSLVPQNDAATYMQAGFQSMQYQSRIGGPLTVIASKQSGSSQDRLLIDIEVLEDNVKPVVQIIGLMLQKVARNPVANLLYQTKWHVSHILNDYSNAQQVSDWLQHIQLLQEDYWQYPEHQQDLSPELEQQAMFYVMHMLEGLGCSMQPGQSFTVAELLEHTGILPHYQKLLSRCLSALEEAGYLDRLADESWTAVKPLTINSQAHATADDSIEMKLLNQCGKSLAEVLTGKTDCLQLLFPQDNAVSASALYSQAEGFKNLNQSLVAVLNSWLQLVPDGKRLKVLEIGAGTGGTTKHILPLLAQFGDFDYVFTDVSNAFLTQARSQFGNYRQLRYEILDISQCSDQQGFDERDFDLIVAANVIHATPNLDQSLDTIHQLLAQNGMFVLLEGLQARLWVDLIFGLTTGWWSFTDQRLQQNYPLLDEQGWRQQLSGSGFEQTACITPKLDATQRLCQQSVIISRPGRKETASTYWLILCDQSGLAEQTAKHLIDQGDQCLLVSFGEQLDCSNAHRWIVNPLQANDLTQLIASWRAVDDTEQRAVLNFTALDALIDETASASQVETTLSRVCAGMLHLVQALATDNQSLQTLSMITRGAQQVTASDQVQPVMSALWGMSRVVAKEYPQFQCRMLDLPIDMTLNAAFFRQITRTDVLDEQQSAIRDQHIYVPRLCSGQLLEQAPLSIKPDSVYLVTGAFGGMGLKVTRWLVKHGARHLLLLSRSEPSDSIRQYLQELRTNGVNVETDAIDIGNEEQLEQVIAGLRHEQLQLSGIFHCAGVYADCLLQDYNWQVFSQVFCCKSARCLESTPAEFIIEC